MDNKDIMVSVICTAYNHEKYIRQCLDGFVMQKTNFEFEVIVHDDASTDNTANIIREYEKLYPNIIKPIYQKENQYSKGQKITRKLCMEKAKGKYIALCEGDDFWTDERKLQVQFDALESNPSCKLCLCKVRAVQENGEVLTQTFPSNPLSTGLYKSFDLLDVICKEYSFQTSSYFFGSSTLKKYFIDEPEFYRVAPVGDWPYLLYFSQFDIYYINDEMSCYRKNAIGNFSTTMNVSSISKQKKYYNSMIEMINEYDKYTNYKYHNLCKHFDRFNEYYYRLLLQEKNYKEIFSNKLYKKFLKNESKKDQLAIRLSYYCPWLIKVVKQSKTS